MRNMMTLIDRLLEANFTDHVLTDIDLNNLLDGTPAARYGMVNKALKKGELIKIRRGLYILAEKYRRKKISKFYLASRIVPHSYVSLESALAYYGWIPERVTLVTNVSACGRTKAFTTPFGEFEFYYFPINEYEFLTQVNRVEEIEDEPFLIASPLRALADLIYVKKLKWQGLKFLTHSLRIEPEQIQKIDGNQFSEIKCIYRSTHVLRFLNNLKRELKK